MLSLKLFGVHEILEIIIYRVTVFCTPEFQCLKPLTVSNSLPVHVFLSVIFSQYTVYRSFNMELHMVGVIPTVDPSMGKSIFRVFIFASFAF